MLRIFFVCHHLSWWIMIIQSCLSSFNKWRHLVLSLLKVGESEVNKHFRTKTTLKFAKIGSEVSKLSAGHGSHGIFFLSYADVKLFNAVFVPYCDRKQQYVCEHSGLPRDIWLWIFICRPKRAIGFHRNRLGVYLKARVLAGEELELPYVAEIATTGRTSLSSFVGAISQRDVASAPRWLLFSRRSSQVRLYIPQRATLLAVCSTCAVLTPFPTVLTLFANRVVDISKSLPETVVLSHNVSIFSNVGYQNWNWMSLWAVIIFFIDIFFILSYFFKDNVRGCFLVAPLTRCEARLK